MSHTRSKFLLGMRLFAIFIGIILVFWLSVEDTTESIAILFSILICTWLEVMFLVRKKNSTMLPLYNFILAAVLAGAAVTPLSLSLMVFKTGLHAHPIPDFTIQQIISVIYRTPIWLTGGILINMGFGIWLKSQQTQPESCHAAER